MIVLILQASNNLSALPKEITLLKNWIKIYRSSQNSIEFKIFTDVPDIKKINGETVYFIESKVAHTCHRRQLLYLQLQLFDILSTTFLYLDSTSLVIDSIEEVFNMNKKNDKKMGMAVYIPKGYPEEYTKYQMRHGECISEKEYVLRKLSQKFGLDKDICNAIRVLCDMPRYDENILFNPNVILMTPELQPILLDAINELSTEEILTNDRVIEFWSRLNNKFGFELPAEYCCTIYNTSDEKRNSDSFVSYINNSLAKIISLFDGRKSLTWYYQRLFTEVAESLKYHKTGP